MQFPSSETLYALGGALGGGLFVKWLDRFYGLKEKRLDVIDKIREDLQRELKETRAELDEWKDKYYVLLETHITHVPPSDEPRKGE